MRPPPRPARRGAALAAAITAIAMLALLLPAITSPHTHQLQVQFPTADGLLGGSNVLESGAQVGVVSNIVPERNNTAMVTISIDDSNWPLHRGTSIAIRPESLLGEKYVAITDGPQSAPPLNSTAVIVESQAAVPVELDQFIDSLDPEARLAAETLVDDLGAGVAGQGQTINQAVAAARSDLANLAATGKVLNGRDPDLDEIIVSLDSLLQEQTTPTQLTQLQQLIGNGNATLTAVEDEQASFERSFVDASATLTNLNTALSGAIPSLREVLSEAPGTLQSVTAESQLLSSMASGVQQQPVLGALIGGIERGPQVTGGALEHTSTGEINPIFRICLSTPAPGACDGSASTSGAPIPSSQMSFALVSDWLAA